MLDQRKKGIGRFCKRNLDVTKCELQMDVDFEKKIKLKAKIEFKT